MLSSSLWQIQVIGLIIVKESKPRFTFLHYDGRLNQDGWHERMVLPNARLGSLKSFG